MKLFVLPGDNLVLTGVEGDSNFPLVVEVCAVRRDALTVAEAWSYNGLARIVRQEHPGVPYRYKYATHDRCPVDSSILEIRWTTGLLFDYTRFIED